MCMKTTCSMKTSRFKREPYKNNARCLRHKNFIEWISYLYYIQLDKCVTGIRSKFIHLHVLFNHAEKRLVFVPAFLIARQYLALCCKNFKVICLFLIEFVTFYGEEQDWLLQQWYHHVIQSTMEPKSCWNRTLILK